MVVPGFNAPPPAWRSPLDQVKIPLLVTTVFPRSLTPSPPAAMTVLLEAMVTEAAPFQTPATQVKAPLMTFTPTRLPAFSTTLLLVTVPLMLKLPADRYVVPVLLVVV